MSDCRELLQYILPKMGYRWAGFRKVRRQVCRRIHRRMQELHITNYTDYLKYIEKNSGEMELLDTMLDITITRFWRDRGVYKLIEKTVFPDLILRAKRENRASIHCWSAGCCNGEEAYSLLLLWDIRLSPDYIHLSITATDRNETVLNRAHDGCYHEGSMRDVPDDILKIGFNQTADGYAVKERYKDRVRFLRQDIRHDMPDNIFDIILCRNLVFTYFNDMVQTTLLKKILSRLRPGGYLIIGSNEQLPGDNKTLEKIKKGEPVYRYRES